MPIGALARRRSGVVVRDPGVLGPRPFVVGLFPDGAHQSRPPALEAFGIASLAQSENSLRHPQKAHLRGRRHAEVEEVRCTR